LALPYHAYSWLIHRLTYRRTNRGNHARGCEEELTATTSFDMTVLKDRERFELVVYAIDRLLQTGDRGICSKQQLKDKRIEHTQAIAREVRGMLEVRAWKWG
jgi:xylulose-5-phosphate/fructose-6-phosphate phosphoketolase